MLQNRSYFPIDRNRGVYFDEKIYTILTRLPTQENPKDLTKAVSLYKVHLLLFYIKLEGKPHHLASYLNIQNNSESILTLVPQVTYMTYKVIPNTAWNF